MIGIVASGLFSGYDGPIAHVGAIVAILIVKYSKRIPFIQTFLYGHKKHEKDSESGSDLANVLFIVEKRMIRIFAATGAAAGMTAVRRSRHFLLFFLIRFDNILLFFSYGFELNDDFFNKYSLFFL